MLLRVMFLFVALLVSSASSAEEINIQLGNDTARFMYITEAFGQDFGRLELEAGFLYNDNNDTLVNAGLLVRGESVSVPIIVAIGARAYVADIADYDIGVLAIGGDLLLAPEAWGGFGAGIYFYTAPGIVSFGDADDLTEYGAYVNFQVTPQARVALGYQKIEVSIINVGDIEIDEGAYFRLNLSF